VRRRRARWGLNISMLGIGMQYEAGCSATRARGYGCKLAWGRGCGRFGGGGPRAWTWSGETVDLRSRG